MKNSIAKAFIGLASLIITLGVVLFISAGTYEYWQGWLYLFIFFLCCLLITMYLIKRDRQLLQRRLTAGPAGEKEKSQKIIQSIAQLAFIAIYIICGLDRRFGWSNMNTYLVFTADIGVLIGFYIVFRTFKENTFTGASITVGEDQKVVSTGPYAIVRHPMYSGALLLLISTPVALGSWRGLLTIIPMFIVIVARLLDEERFLKIKLGGYITYCQKIKWRLLPGIF